MTKNQQIVHKLTDLQPQPRNSMCKYDTKNRATSTHKGMQITPALAWLKAQVGTMMAHQHCTLLLHSALALHLNIVDLAPQTTPMIT